MHAIAVRRLALIPSALLALGGLTFAPAVTPSAAADTPFNPVYRICNAAASHGYNNFYDQNYLRRDDPNLAQLKAKEGECKDWTITPDTAIRLIGYNSFRVTSDLNAPANSSSYGPCQNSTTSRPKQHLKYKAYYSTGCTNPGGGE